MLRNALLVKIHILLVQQYAVVVHCPSLQCQAGVHNGASDALRVLKDSNA